MKTKSPLTKIVVIAGLSAMLSTQTVHASCSERYTTNEPTPIPGKVQDVFATYAAFCTIPFLAPLSLIGSLAQLINLQNKTDAASSLGLLHDLLGDRDVSDETKKEIQDLEAKNSKMSSISAIVAPYRAAISKRMKSVRSDFDGEILVDRSDGKEVLYNITKNGAPFGRDVHGTPKQKNGLPMLKVYTGPRPVNCEYSADFEKMSDVELAKRIADFDNGESSCVEDSDQDGKIEYNNQVINVELLSSILCESPADKAAQPQIDTQPAVSSPTSSSAPKASASSL